MKLDDDGILYDYTKKLNFLDGETNVVHSSGKQFNVYKNSVAKIANPTKKLKKKRKKLRPVVEYDKYSFRGDLI